VIRVLIADDQGIVRDGLRMIVDAQDDMEVVGEARDGVEAVALVRTARPDVVLMDVRMPRVDGLEATRQLMSAQDPPRVLVLTTFGEERTVYEAMKAGASGFLLKDSERRSLLQAIRAVAVGDETLDPAITRRLIEEMARRPPAVNGVPAELAHLSARELEVMSAVAKGLSNREIAAELVVSETTVKSHVAAVLRKLGARDRMQLVIAAYETGLVAAGDA
jgi:DNA-binding NarL/FixJ family response regulator